MYYRRKIILALIERFGGELKPTHFQKLLLLFTRRQRKPAYDFVPYKYGAFSFQARADKRTMIKYGQLKDSKHWVFSADISYLEELNQKDQKILNELWKQFYNYSIEELVKYTYLEFPFYATRSEIAEELLTEDELKRVEFSRPQNLGNTLYTIGYEGISAEEYMNRLYSKQINLLVDVRKNSMSMKYGFSKSQLKNMCQKMGIKFLHIPELGIESDKRQNLNSPKDYELLFDEYKRETLPNRNTELNQLKELTEEYERIAITCFEREHTSCHRHKISDYLHTEYGMPIEHL